VKRSTLSRAAVVPAAFVLTTGLAACGAANEQAPAGGSDAGAGVSGTLDGAGSSAQAAAMEAWIAGFAAQNPDATVNYDPSGSGAGREQFTAGAVAFAGSDAYLEGDELAAAQQRCGGDVIELPNYISPIAVVYNLDGVDDLQLAPATIAGIFDGKITTWNDPAIAADNPDATLPDTKITPVHRSDESGTTENFVDYLSKTAGAAWPYEVSGDWPTGGGEAAKGTSGVIGAVQAGSGTIGYADASQAGDLGTAKVKVGDEFVAPSPESAAKIVSVSSPVEGRGQYDHAIELARDTTESGVYPIVLASYHLACPTYDDPATADLVKAFLSYVVSTDGQQAAADAAGSAPITDTEREQATAAIEAVSAG
jgi:phosphate transport system substrate-binding protein